MQRKTKRLEIRLTQEQKALLRRAAEARAESLTQFILRTSELGAREVLAQTDEPVRYEPATPESEWKGYDRFLSPSPHAP